jgi:hypothetical protein
MINPLIGIVDAGLQHNDTVAQFQERCCRVALDSLWKGKEDDLN